MVMTLGTERTLFINTEISIFQLSWRISTNLKKSILKRFKVEIKKYYWTGVNEVLNTLKHIICMCVI